MQWHDVSTLHGVETCLLQTDGGETIARVKRVGGSFVVTYKGTDIAFRPDLDTAKRAAEQCHANCE